MGFVGDFIGDIFGGGGDDAAEATIHASDVQANLQRDALAYLKEKERLPRQLSESALKGLAGVYGLPGGTGSQEDLIERATASPLYQSIMGGREAGEEAILRSASATGGLRSGDVQSNLYDYNTQLQNQALLTSYNQQLQGLTGMAGLPSYARDIAGMTEGIGQTLAQGRIAAEQARQDSGGQGFDSLMGLGSLGLSAYGSGLFGGASAAGAAGGLGGLGGLLSSGAGAGMLMFSDRRLKKNIKKIDEVNGHNWYTWDWNIVANKMGLPGKSEGVMADEIVKTNPDCIGFKDGFMVVDYKKLGIFSKEVANA